MPLTLSLDTYVNSARLNTSSISASDGGLEDVPCSKVLRSWIVPGDFNTLKIKLSNVPCGDLSSTRLNFAPGCFA